MYNQVPNNYSYQSYNNPYGMINRGDASLMQQQVQAQIPQPQQNKGEINCLISPIFYLNSKPSTILTCGCGCVKACPIQIASAISSLTILS